MTHERPFRIPRLSSAHATPAEIVPRNRAVDKCLPSSPIQVAESRRIATAAMRRWAVPSAMADEAVLVVSELMTNAIVHGADEQGSVGLRMQYGDGQLRIEVTDGNPEPARLKAAEDDDLGGRGLHLVEELASTWGTSDAGHTTWAVFSTQLGEHAC